jgi:uncharacterized membrane protein
VLRDKIKHWKHWETVLPILLILGIAMSYYPVRETMILQRSWYVATQTNVTLNFILFFFFYGVICDRMTKKMSRRKGWIIWATGMALLMVFFKIVGGYPTIFG